MRRNAACPFLKRPFRTRGARRGPLRRAHRCDSARQPHRAARLRHAVPALLDSGVDLGGTRLTLARRPSGAALVSGAPIALTIVALVVFGTIAFALLGVRRIKMDPQQFIVGGRSFGTIFLWVLLAGEIYTSFTFLGASGWAYGMGAPAYYILAYGSCAYVIGYFLLPAIWRVGKERSLLTAPDFFTDRYGSRALGVFVGITQF